MNWARIWDEVERQGLRLLIVAGTRDQFRWWCDEHRVSPHNPAVKYVASARTLAGYHQAKNVRLIKYGTWYDRDDLRDAIRIFEQFNPPTP